MQRRWQEIANALIFHEQESRVLRLEWERLKEACSHPSLPERLIVEEYRDTCPDCGYVAYCHALQWWR